MEDMRGHREIFAAFREAFHAAGLIPPFRAAKGVA